MAHKCEVRSPLQGFNDLFPAKQQVRLEEILLEGVVGGGVDKESVSLHVLHGQMPEKFPPFRFFPGPDKAWLHDFSCEVDGISSNWIEVKDGPEQGVIMVASEHHSTAIHDNIHAGLRVGSISHQVTKAHDLPTSQLIDPGKYGT